MQIWHPFTNRALDPVPLIVQRAEGVYLHTADGRKIIDAISSWWVNLHGHSHPRIAAAVAEQARKLEHVILAGFTHDAAEELATRLQKWLPRELTHLFFSDDGSTAVEVALKLAVQYFRNLERPQKCEIVALAHGYHGDTAGAMSVSDESPFTAPFRSMRYPVHRVHSAYCYRCPVGLQRESCHIECVQQLEGLLAERGERIAAVIVEPLLQGAGGMIVHPVEFLQQVRARCTKHDVLFIADEVLTGFGRTGKMFACGLANVVPDLMCLSKGLTGGFMAMGATLCTDRVEAAFRSENRLHTFYHGHSYTGNALACAAANASLQVFEDEPVFDRIATIARINSERLAQLRGMHQVGDARQLGTMGAIELVADDAGYLSALRPKLYGFFLEHGVLLRPLGNVVYVLPPYVIEPDELHRVYDVIVEAIETLL
ncbi:MAG TPA: adenosylmethionine--8-amino-7-oxononanoate transaminase [Candidatus Sulfotelmatobacter sp.]|nr:adenosylmethionine--8-amino-7-oxononanoate transaminase [Candidatus Sulfotelmatobacter sp.]